MASFDVSIKVVLQHEGGWVCDPADAGGETNFGISTLIIKRIQAEHGLTSAQMETRLGISPNTLYQPGYLKPMSVTAAENIYHEVFWLPAYEQLNSQTVATKVFDFAVNAGAAHAHEVAQRAAVACGQACAVDGAFGPKSVAAVNAAGLSFVQAMANEMAVYYKARVAARPANAKFLSNWLHRAAWGT